MSSNAQERLSRVLNVMPLIVDRGDVSLADVGSLAGIDALTLLDDLRVLTERDDEPGGFVEAVRVLFEAESVSVQSPLFGRPTRITLPELCALQLGLAVLLAASDPSERETISRARERIKGAIVALPESATRGDLWYASAPLAPDDQTLATLRGGATGKNKVRILYRRGDSTQATERVVHPYAVLPLRGAWFLVAHCERSGGVRFFRVDRVEAAEALGDSFEANDDFSLDTSLSADRLLSSTRERLVVRYSPRIARWIDEREKGEFSPDGSLTVSHPLSDDAWAVRHVLQYGPEAEAIAPARVRAGVVATLHAMLSATRVAGE